MEIYIHGKIDRTKAIGYNSSIIIGECHWCFSLCAIFLDTNSCDNSKNDICLLDRWKNTICSPSELYFSCGGCLDNKATPLFFANGLGDFRIEIEFEKIDFLKQQYKFGIDGYSYLADPRRVAGKNWSKFPCRICNDYCDYVNECYSDHRDIDVFEEIKTVEQAFQYVLEVIPLNDKFEEELKKDITFGIVFIFGIGNIEKIMFGTSEYCFTILQSTS